MEVTDIHDSPPAPLTKYQVLNKDLVQCTTLLHTTLSGIVWTVQILILIPKWSVFFRTQASSTRQEFPGRAVAFYSSTVMPHRT